jgi:SNF family Na+-dependent transporter
MPCVLGWNVWSGFTPFGPGSNIMDLEDFIVSNVLLPLGSLCFVIFCIWKYGNENQFHPNLNKTTYSHHPFLKIILFYTVNFNKEIYPYKCAKLDFWGILI